MQAGEVRVTRATDRRGWELPGRTEKSFLQDFLCQMKQVGRNKRVSSIFCRNAIEIFVPWNSSESKSQYAARNVR